MCFKSEKPGTLTHRKQCSIVARLGTRQRVNRCEAYENSVSRYPMTNKVEQRRVRSDTFIPCNRAGWLATTGYMALLFGGWEVKEWMAEQRECRENATLKSREGRRDPGIGEEFHGEVCPSEMANALPGMHIFSLGGKGTGRGLVMVGCAEDAWGVASFLIGGGSGVLVGCLWMMVAVIEKRGMAVWGTGWRGLCRWVVSMVLVSFDVSGFVGDGSSWLGLCRERR